MKKFLFCLFAMLAITGAFAQQQAVVAVAPFDAISGITATEANMITRVFYIRLGNTNSVRLVDRSVVERVLREHNFQTGDWSNTQKTAELGNALNADWIVRGELEKFGSSILVTVQFYDIKTFEFKGGSDVRIANAEAAYDNMDPLVDKLVQTIASYSATVTYNIGDRGPGGGIVFFAESGVYMECSMDIGSYNWEGAIQAARNYRGGGLTDWRLPTLNDLVLMFNNLKLKGLGGFSGGGYWSSQEHNKNNAYFLSFNFKDARSLTYAKKNALQIRAIRSF